MTAAPRIKLRIERKPPPPALDPFECVACQEMVERDPYQPDWERAPICNYCNWRSNNRLQCNQLPFSMWADFRRFYSVMAALEKEIIHVRRGH